MRTITVGSRGRLQAKRSCALAGLLALSLTGYASMVSAQAQRDFSATSSTQLPPQTMRRPNIVLIMVDDLGVEAINAYGGEYATPHIDALSRQGATFANAHAMPLCTPSRARIMTGIENAKSYQAFGYLAPTSRTFGHVLKEAGYATAIVGKWQLSGNGFDGRVGMEPLKAGFDEAMLWQVATGAARGSRYWGPTFWKNGYSKVNESGFGPDMASDFALDFIDRNKDKPFFLYYPMVLPHSPFVPTPDSLTAQSEKERFAGMVNYADKLVGKVIDKLAELKLDQNTVVIFTGDNGTNRAITSYRNGAPVRGGKGEVTINGTHVPMIVRWSGQIQAGSHPDGLFDFTDMLPTLAEIGGAQLPATGIDGKSQLPVMLGKKPEVRDWIFMHYAPAWISKPARFIFDAHWKLYGDGRFVALDSEHDSETEVKKLTPEAGRKRKFFDQLLSNMGDGPLDPVRFPMCKGKPSLVADQPAEISGCKRSGPVDDGE